MSIHAQSRPVFQSTSCVARWWGYLLAGCLVLALAGCAGMGGKNNVTHFGADNLAAGPQGQEVMIMAMDLIDTGYKFGGKNPEAGVDCSGMVSWLYRQGADYSLKGSARDMAKRGREITPAAIRPGDLVFFNTQGYSYSHVGIYIGDQRFIHAPNSRGKVRIDRLDQGWFATRFEEARSYLD